MTIQAAIEGLGVVLGWSRLVEADIAAGRLIAPFDTVLPAEAGYYVVVPASMADAPNITLFREWLIASVIPGRSAPLPW